MIIFKRLPDGTWERSGSILPTETHYRIAVDAENPERMTYPCDHAVQEVENRIKAGTSSYRFELAMPPARFLKSARAPEPKVDEKAAHELGEKTVRRILRNTAKAAVRKPKAKNAETGKQRRARLKREGLCTACGKRKPQKDRFECKTCADYYKAWAAKKAGK
jgi:hypothetical protein